MLNIIDYITIGIKLIAAFVFWLFLAFCVASAIGFTSNLYINNELLIKAISIHHAAFGSQIWVFYIPPYLYAYIFIGIILLVAHLVYFEAITTNSIVNIITLLMHTLLWPLGIFWHALFYRKYYFQFLENVGHPDAKSPYYDSVWGVYGIIVVAVVILFFASSTL